MKVLNILAQTVLTTAKVATSSVATMTKVAHETALVAESAVVYAKIKTAHKLDNQSLLAQITNKNTTFKQVFQDSHDQDATLSQVIDGRKNMEDLLKRALSAHYVAF